MHDQIHVGTERRTHRRLLMLGFTTTLAVTAALLVPPAATAANPEVGVYTGTETVAGPGENDTDPVELGTRFTVSTAGSVTAIRFYKNSANTGTHTGALWSSSGARLASVTFTGESKTGWQTARLSTPVKIVTGQSYVASYHTDTGRYAAKVGAFSNGATIGNATIRAQAGVYRYGTSAYPSSTWQGAAYYVDALFTAQASTSTPVVTSSPRPSAPPTPTPVVTPTVTPKPVPPTTPSAGFPDETNAGVPAGTTLKRVPEDVTSGKGWHFDTRGWVSIDDPGAVFSGFQTAYNVNVFAENATITNNLITSSGADYNISLRHASGAKIDHNTIHGASATSPCDNGIRGMYGDDDNVTISANNIYWCSSGINHFDQGGLIRDNFIHDLGHGCTAGDVNCGHFNGIQLGAGFGPLMTIDHNTIFNPSPATDAIMLANDDGNQDNRKITNNLLGGAGYTFYGSGWEGAAATHITFTGNRFSTRYFPASGSLGPVAHWNPSSTNVWSGNVWADGPNTGKTVSP